MIKKNKYKIVKKWKNENLLVYKDASFIINIISKFYQKIKWNIYI